MRQMWGTLSSKGHTFSGPSSRGQTFIGPSSKGQTLSGPSSRERGSPDPNSKGHRSTWQSFSKRNFGQGPEHEGNPDQDHMDVMSGETVEQLKDSAFHGVFFLFFFWGPYISAKRLRRGSMTRQTKNPIFLG